MESQSIAKQYPGVRGRYDTPEERAKGIFYIQNNNYSFKHGKDFLAL